MSNVSLVRSKNQSWGAKKGFFRGRMQKFKFVIDRAKLFEKSTNKAMRAEQ